MANGDFWSNLQGGFGRNSNALIGLGSGLLSQPNFSRGLAAAGQGWQQGAGLDYQMAEQQEAEAEAQQYENATRTLLEQEAPDLVPWVDAGRADEAFNEYARRKQPKAAPDPFTLGAGDIRYDGYGQPIAYGGEQQPETIINNSMGGTDEFYGQLDKNLATQTSDLIGAGMNAQSNNIRLGQLEEILQTAPQGMQGGLTQAVGALGIPTEGLDDVQAAQALINQMVPGQRPPGSGTMSDADLALFKQSLPAIINQPGGNQKILGTMQAINEYTIAQAQIAQQVANREISPAEGRAMQAQVPNPLAGIQTAATPAVPGTRLRFNPATGQIE